MTLFWVVIIAAFLIATSPTILDWWEKRKP